MLLKEMRAQPIVSNSNSIRIEIETYANNDKLNRLLVMIIL